MTSASLPPDDLPPRDLPPKREVAMVLLQSANSVYVHLDPRVAEVLVPTWFKKQPQLVLQVGLNMAVPIVDLDVGEEALSCTLSFNRSPHYCFIPWDAVYALVDPDGRGMVWPDSVPPEVARASGAGRGSDGSRKPPAAGGKNARPRLRLAQDPSEQSAAADSEESAAASAEKAAPGDGDRDRMTDPAPSAAPVIQEAVAPQAETPGGSSGAEPSSEPEGATQSEPGEPGAGDAGKRRPPYLRLVK